MAIEGLDDLVNKMETSSTEYNDNIDKLFESLDNFIADKSVEDFLDDYLSKYGEESSGMSIEEKEHKAKMLAFDEHEQEILDGKTIDVKDKDGKVIAKKDANEVEKFEKLLADAKNKAEERKNKFYKNKVEHAKYIQEYQAKLIENVENELKEIKQEIERRKNEQKDLSNELDNIENNEIPDLDRNIAQKETEKNELEEQIAQNEEEMEDIIKANPDGYEDDDRYKALLYKNGVNKRLVSDLDKEIKDLNDTKSTKEKRADEIKTKKDDLKVDEYERKYQKLNDDLNIQKDKYKENSIKLEKKFNELGVSYDEKSQAEDSKTQPDGPSNDAEKTNTPGTKGSNNAPAGGGIPTDNVEKNVEEKSLVKVPSQKQMASNMIKQYIDNPDPNERIDRLSNTDDYENLMNSINNLPITDYSKKKQLQNCLAQNTEILNDNIKENQYYVDMLKGILGKELSPSQVDMCARLFNTTPDKKGNVNNILSGTNKLSKEDLYEISNIINQAKNSDLTPEKREEFEKNFLNYVKMGSLNSQSSRSFAAKFLYNNAPTKKAGLERQLENSIRSYSDFKEKSQKSNDNFFNYLHDSTNDPSKYPSLDPEYTSHRDRNRDSKGKSR